MKVKEQARFHILAILNSYSQIFFSDNTWFALLLLLATFIDPFTGLSGVIAIIVTNLFAIWFGFSHDLVKNGTYGYNSLMVGLVIGVYYQFNAPFFVILVLASLFTLLLTLWMGTLALKNRVPFLSLPFLISVWVVLLSVRTYNALGLSDRGIYAINELWSYGGHRLVEINAYINSIKIPLFWDTYLKSLGAIMFQYNLISGVLIAIGLLLYSRISFSLSLIGFTTGFLFYYFVGGKFTDLYYSYIGFNFILSAIALGGFFIIPSKKSYLLVLLATPLIGILISAMASIFNMLQLPLYSLPFNVIVLLFLFVFNHRLSPKNLHLVQHQHFSPEKNLYAHLNYQERFKNDTYFHIHIPYFGEWIVSQGHDGKITHKGEWKYAWDFVVIDEENNTYRLPGVEVSDYYCYDLPVLAPADGYVQQIIDDIDDNKIGDVNLEENWGNSIIIRHGDFLYSNLSHIKKGTFKVKIGDYVKKGDIIARCGSSGRSPEPHLHFQLQATPYVGSQTLKYPISYYVVHKDHQFEFHSFDYPEENQKIARIAPNKLLRDSFRFIPGQIFNFNVEHEDGTRELVKWEVFVDAYNQAYIYDEKTKSTAYFTNNDTLLYFTGFYGDKKSLLYYFYVGAYKILMGYYQDMKVHDQLPISLFYSGILKGLHDFTAPFFIYLKTNYYSVFKKLDNEMHPTHAEIATVATVSIGRQVQRKVSTDFVLEKDHIQQFTVQTGSKKMIATCVEES